MNFPVCVKKDAPQTKLEPLGEPGDANNPSEFLRACAWCKKIEVDGAWLDQLAA